MKAGFDGGELEMEEHTRAMEVGLKQKVRKEKAELSPLNCLSNKKSR